MVPTSRRVLNKTLWGLARAPAQSKRLLHAGLSYDQSAPVALPLKHPMAPHCLQDRVHAPKWFCMSESLDLGRAEHCHHHAREGLAGSLRFQTCSELGDAQMGTALGKGRR